MRVRHVGNEMLIACPAKLNLFLELLGKREDGYHEIETLMTTVSIWDHFRFHLRDDDALCLNWIPMHGSANRIESDPIPTDDRNLIVRSLNALRRRAQKINAGIPLPGIDIVVRKTIPSAAGLGGASANAAAALIAGNRLWKLGMSRESLSHVAAEIGSDVPFFLWGGQAISRGRGEIITPLHHLAPLEYVIAKPTARLSTADVFAQVDHSTSRRPLGPILQRLRRTGGRQLADVMFNRLSNAAAKLTPELDRLTAQFDALPTLGHQLSGSGSSYFGVFESRRLAQHATQLLKSRNPDWRVFRASGCRESRDVIPQGNA